MNKKIKMFLKDPLEQLSDGFISWCIFTGMVILTISVCSMIGVCIYGFIKFLCH